jgi:hypothetical protein
MRSRHLALAMVLAVAAVWLVPRPAEAALKVATLTVKGMVCQA